MPIRARRIAFVPFVSSPEHWAVICPQRSHRLGSNDSPGLFLYTSIPTLIIFFLTVICIFPTQRSFFLFFLVVCTFPYFHRRRLHPILSLFTPWHRTASRPFPQDDGNSFRPKLRDSSAISFGEPRWRNRLGYQPAIVRLFTFDTAVVLLDDCLAVPTDSLLQANSGLLYPYVLIL